MAQINAERKMAPCSSHRKQDCPTQTVKTRQDSIRILTRLQCRRKKKADRSLCPLYLRCLPSPRKPPSIIAYKPRASTPAAPRRPFGVYDRALVSTGAPVFCLISSILTPGANSVSFKPSGVTSSTHRSVMILLTTPTPVSGKVHLSRILC